LVPSKEIGSDLPLHLPFFPERSQLVDQIGQRPVPSRQQSNLVCRAEAEQAAKEEVQDSEEDEERLHGSDGHKDDSILKNILHELEYSLQAGIVELTKRLSLVILRLGTIWASSFGSCHAILHVALLGQTCWIS